MPLYATSEEWQRYTALLLEARPTTTRIVTKYTIPPRPSKAAAAKLRAKREAYQARKTAAGQGEGALEAGKDSASAAAAAAAPEKTRAYLELRTYDPESGVVLKYRTDKAAEVGRLIAGLGKMGRIMGALPAADGDVVMEDADAGDDAAGAGPAAAAAAEGAHKEAQRHGQAASGQGKGAQQGQSGGGAGGGGKGKKKKGKR